MKKLINNSVYWLNNIYFYLFCCINLSLFHTYLYYCSLYLLGSNADTTTMLLPYTPRASSSTLVVIIPLLICMTIYFFIIHR